MIKLMYITNRTEIAEIADSVGVERIFIDMEYIGKSQRQKGMDTVQNHHTIEDVIKIKNKVNAEILVRINPIHEATGAYTSSKEEVDAVLNAGADIIMLPFFKTAEEVKKCVSYVAGRVKVLPLIETPEAVEVLDEILEIKEIEEVFIGLNDLSIGYGKKFMFELLADGTVEKICLKCKQKGVSYGFGGIAAIGKGILPAENIIKEHYRLGSTCTILSRSFCDINHICDISEIRKTFVEGVGQIRTLELECEQYSQYFRRNEEEVAEKVKKICEN